MIWKPIISAPKGNQKIIEILLWAAGHDSRVHDGDKEYHCEVGWWSDYGETWYTPNLGACSALYWASLPETPE